MKVRLVLAHRINGVRHEAGAELEVTDLLGQVLLDRKFAERIGDAAAVMRPSPMPIPARTVPSVAPKAVKPKFSCCGWK